MGRPIDADGDRPIDQEEGLLRRPDEEDDALPANDPGQSSHTKPTPPSIIDTNAGKSRRDLITAALAALGETEQSNNDGNNINVAPPKPAIAAPGAAAGMLSKLLPQQGRPNAMVSSSSTMRPPPPPNPVPNLHPSHAQQNHQRYMNQRAQNQNQNPNPNLVQQNKSATTGEAAKRPPTPSIGGFHFPPGVVCLAFFLSHKKIT
jgi:hypothetical protein